MPDTTRSSAKSRGASMFVNRAIAFLQQIESDMQRMSFAVFHWPLEDGDEQPIHEAFACVCSAPSSPGVSAAPTIAHRISRTSYTGTNAAPSRSRITGGSFAMSTLHSTMPPAVGFPSPVTRISKPKAGHATSVAPPVQPKTKPNTNFFVPLRDFDDDDWVCRRSID